MIGAQFKPYPKYKKSGVEWIGEIPEGWDEKRFCFLFSFGKGLSITKEDLLDEGIPCVSYGEIHSKYGFEVDPQKHELKRVKEDYLKSNPNSLLKQGDFIFADTSEDIEGSGNFTYLNSKVITFAGYHTIIAKPKATFDSRYIAYLFDSISFRTQIRSEVAGIKVYSITKTILKDIIVILPPLPEQHAIAAFLDRETARIDAIISKQTRMIELLKEKRSALITQAVTKGLDPNAKMKTSGVEWIGEIPEGWEVKKIVFVLEKIQDGTHFSPENTPDGEYPYITAKNIKEYGIDLTEITYVTKAAHSEIYRRCPVRENDVLYIKDGATAGIATVNTLKDEFSMLSSVAMLRPKPYEYEPRYLAYHLNMPSFKKFVLQNLVGGAMTRFTIEIIKRFRLITPTIEEQRTISNFLDSETRKIDSLISKIETQISLLNEYRQSLITHAVTGKIDVRGVSNE